MSVAVNGGPKLSQKELEAFIVEATSTTIASQYVMLAGRTFFVFYWLDNLAEELDKIWAGEWTTGKVLFLATNYTVLFRGLVDLPSQITFFPMTSQGCWNYVVVIQVLNYVQTYAPAGSILLTLHTLLGARRKHLVVILVLFSGFLVFAVVMVGLYLSGLKPQAGVFPISKYSPCMYRQDKMVFNTVLTFANVAREAVVFVFGLWVVCTRYRKQNDFLIRAIKRDGGAYLIAAIFLGIVAAILRTPNLPFYDKYSVVTEIRLILYPVLANRLLLNLRDTTDYTTRTAVSNILFHSSRFDDQEPETDLQEVFDRRHPEGTVAKGLAAGREMEDDQDEGIEPSSAIATGVESRTSGPLRYNNGSMV